MTALVILEAIVILLLVILVAGLLRSHADILRRLHALDSGEASASPNPASRPSIGQSPLDAISGTSPDGAATSIALTGSRGLTALAFLSSTCTGCQPFWRQIGGDMELPHSEMRLVVVTKGPQEESPTAIAGKMSPGTKLVMASEAWDAFRVPASPFFVLVDSASGAVLGEGTAPTWRRLVRMFKDALGDAELHASSTSQRSGTIDEVLEANGIDTEHSSLWANPSSDA